MNESGFLSLDGRSLQVFLQVYQYGSMTTAADKLGVTQSAVSHTLDKLRKIFNDPLFVRAGRNITPTNRADQLAVEAQAILDKLSDLVHEENFESKTAELEFVIAANDFQRDLLLPDFYRQVTRQVKSFSLRIIPSIQPTPEALRDNSIDLWITPATPDSPDVMQKRLFSDQRRCFYDASTREAPTNIKEYLQAKHISVMFMENTPDSTFSHVPSIYDQAEQNVVVRVSNFSGIACFLKGSDLLATMPGLYGFVGLSGFSSVALPLQDPALSMYMLWHKKYHNQQSHRWLREQMEIVANKIIGTSSNHSGSM
jgi:DNA-binding transcriptional LysR family regulator